jgi:hypothetical protein
VQLSKVLPYSAIDLKLFTKSVRLFLRICFNTIKVFLNYSVVSAELSAQVDKCAWAKQWCARALTSLLEHAAHEARHAKVGEQEGLAIGAAVKQPV